MSFNFSPKVVTDGLVLYLDAANTKSYTSGSTTWNDISRGGNNGTLVNGPTFSSANGGSLLFDGTNDYTTIPYKSDLNPTNNLTFSQWVKRTVDDTSIRNPIEMIASGDELYFILFRGDLTPKRWQFGIRQSNGTYQQSLTTGYLELNVWYNLTYVADSSNNTLSVYVNGLYDSSPIVKTYNGTLKVNSGATLYIGAESSGGRFFKGNIGTTIIYNRALSAAEVLQNYNALKSRYI